jgi:hypothetical protein
MLTSACFLPFSVNAFLTETLLNLFCPGLLFFLAASTAFM